MAWAIAEVPVRYGMRKYRYATLTSSMQGSKCAMCHLNDHCGRNGDDSNDDDDSGSI